MPDWNSRLAVACQDAAGTLDITPIDAFTPSFSLNAEPMHSIEQTHIGVTYTPRAMTFTMTVKAVGPAAGRLTALALEGKEFDIILQEADGGHDWSFQSVVLSKCIITSATPTTATISGAPAATFSGFSLAAKSTDKNGTAIELP